MANRGSPVWRKEAAVEFGVWESEEQKREWNGKRGS
jgi:hypothetical protein